MKKFFLPAAAVAVLSWSVGAVSVAALDVPPPPKTRVTDLTGTLTSEQKANLERGLAEVEEKTSNQLLVLMIPTLAGDNLEDFSIRVAEKWKPGQKGKDNGAILLVVKDDRRLRIEVGYGLEGALPDALAGTIIRNEIAPRFRKGDYYGGIVAGLRGIVAATKGEYQGQSRAKRRKRGGFSPWRSWIFSVALVAVRRVRRVPQAAARILGLGSCHILRNESSRLLHGQKRIRRRRVRRFLRRRRRVWRGWRQRKLVASISYLRESGET